MSKNQKGSPQKRLIAEHAVSKSSLQYRQLKTDFIRKNITKYLSLLLAVLMGCAASDRWGRVVSWDDFTLGTLPEARDYPDEGAVILLDEGTNEIYPSGPTARSELHRHKIIKIFNKKGYAFASVTIPYSGSTTITNIRARTILPDGTILTLKPDQIFDVNLYPAFVFYSDTRAKRFALPGIQDHCIVEYEYQAYTKSFTYWDHWTFQNFAPTKISRYRIRAPSEWEISWRTTGIEIEPITQELPQGFKQTYLWEARELPPIISEVAMPTLNEVAASLQFSPIGMKTWDDLAAWYHDLASDRSIPDDAIRSKAAELTAQLADERDKLAALYAFVRDHVRYIAISIGIGGYQPHYASQTFLNRYGDCKDKVTLLRAMARSIGIDVLPVIISTWQNGEVDTNLVTPAHFNHLISLAVLSDSAFVWMDATDRHAPFDELPWYDRNRRVLAVDDDGEGHWHVTPTITAAENVISRKWYFQIDSTDMCHGKLLMDLSGATALDTRRELADLRKHDVEEWLGRHVVRRFSDAELEDYEIQTDRDPLKARIAFHMDFSSQDSLQWDISRFALFDLFSYFIAEERTHPIRFKYPQTVRDSICVAPGSDWHLTCDTCSDSVKTPFGHYYLACELSGKHQMTICRELLLERIYIEREMYDEFRSFLRLITATDETVMRLVHSN